MKLIKFPEQSVVFAKDQPNYIPLPAFQHEGKVGRITCCWELTWQDRIKVLFTGKIWHSILTFYRPLQPQKLSVDKPEMTV